MIIKKRPPAIVPHLRVYAERLITKLGKVVQDQYHRDWQGFPWMPSSQERARVVDALRTMFQVIIFSNFTKLQTHKSYQSNMNNTNKHLVEWVVDLWFFDLSIAAFGVLFCFSVPCLFLFVVIVFVVFRFSMLVVVSVFWFCVFVNVDLWLWCFCSFFGLRCVGCLVFVWSDDFRCVMILCV